MEPIPLHVPTLGVIEKEMVCDIIDSGYISSVGQAVTKFESIISDYTGSQHCVASCSGTAALHLALMSVGVCSGDLILTQALSFVATVNAISYTGAKPIFLDIASDTWSLSPSSVENWLRENAKIENGICTLIVSSESIKAVVVMNTFGNPGHLHALKDICNRWKLFLVEDAAESLGSTVGASHTGLIGDVGVYSFNGNKIITTGGGGAVVTSNKHIADRARHLSTTAKLTNGVFFDHDEVGYNYRMPNINAALGLAQLTRIDGFIEEKRSIAKDYISILKDTDIRFFEEISGTRSNYWLCSILCPQQDVRDALLSELLKNGIEARPPWRLLNELPMYQDCLSDTLTITKSVHSRVISLPSTPLKSGPKK